TELHGGLIIADRKPSRYQLLKSAGLTEGMPMEHRPRSDGMDQPAPRRPWLAAALWMAFLGPLFFLVYGACNWITSLRSDVGSCYFGWERLIPFVPSFIIP